MQTNRIRHLLPPPDDSFRSAFRAAYAAFLRDFMGREGRENRTNRGRILCMDAAQQLTQLVPDEGIEFAGIFDLKAAIASLLCEGLAVTLAELCLVHPAFARWEERLQTQGVPDRLAGLRSMRRFAETVLQFLDPEIIEAGGHRSTFEQAIDWYRKARWYPYMPFVPPPLRNGTRHEIAINGEGSDPAYVRFLALPCTHLPEFDPLPGPCAADYDWLRWQARQLSRLPPDSWIWWGDREWQPVDDYLASLRRHSN
jgi:hypothetical protein